MNFKNKILTHLRTRETERERERERGGGVSINLSYYFTCIYILSRVDKCKIHVTNISNQHCEKKTFSFFGAYFRNNQTTIFHQNWIIFHIHVHLIIL